MSDDDLIRRGDAVAMLHHYKFQLKQKARELGLITQGGAANADRARAVEHCIKRIRDPRKLGAMTVAEELTD